MKRALLFFVLMAPFVASEDRSENIRRLLTARADKSIANNEGVTALIQARQMQRPDLIKLLE